MTNDANTRYNLSKKRIAILATDGYEQSELREPMDQLRAMGAVIDIVAPSGTMTDGEIRGWQGTDWGDSVSVDCPLDSADASNYDAIVLPGGVINPDKLRTERAATDFIRTFFEAGKPVASICHGPQVLIECDVLQGRSVTSYPSIKTDLKNAGCRWSDQEVVVDQALVTSRSPDDLPAFIDKIAEEVCEGAHAPQATA